MTLKKIGILHGQERTFPEAFIHSVNSRRIPGVIAEEVILGGTSMEETQQYAVIVDRMSHEVKYYRGYLKLAALNGTRVINNPFWWSADDKFFGTCLAHRIGVAVPKTILLPNKKYPAGVVAESLSNLKWPIDWQGMLNYVGLPAIIKPAEGGGGKSVSKIHNLEELFAAYDQSGDVQMMLQECIDWEHYVRCLCIGQDRILPIKWHPPFGRPMGEYFIDHNHLTPELGEKVVGGAMALNHALGYDMNTVEFAIRNGVPYAIDFTNPAPDFDLHSITPHYFGTVVEWMTDLAIKKAQEYTPPVANPKWWAMMGWNDPLAAVASHGRSHAPSNGSNGRHEAEKHQPAMAGVATKAAPAKAAKPAVKASSPSGAGRPAVTTGSKPATTAAKAPVGKPAVKAPAGKPAVKASSKPAAKKKPGSR
jgi:hypothetical protein